MLKKFSILLLVTMTCVASAQEAPRPATKEAPESRCELTQEDYAVFGALLTGLQGPEDPEEAWQGKEMIIIDSTATPGRTGSDAKSWGFHSKSDAAPAKETLDDYEVKVHGACAVESGFGEPESYKMIPHSEVDSYFKKGVGRGWKEFYEKHPKSAGYWSFSRPGYNSTRDEAVLYVAHSCGGLCGTGHLYLLAKVNGHWTVKNRLMLWIS